MSSIPLHWANKWREICQKNGSNKEEIIKEFSMYATEEEKILFEKWEKEKNDKTMSNL